MRRQVCAKWTAMNLVWVIALMAAGCVQAPYQDPVVSAPIVDDPLTNGRTTAERDGGHFIREGWQPGYEGSLTYSLPVMTQGVIEFEAKGLSRAQEATRFLTIFETPPGEYVEPYINKNPYLVTLSTLAYSEHPDASLGWLWTMKSFADGLDEEERYVSGIPDNATGYEQTAMSSEISLYPDEFHSIRMQWRNGVARLTVDGEQVAEHRYRPMVYRPDGLRIVLGKSPLDDSLHLPGMVLRNVKISYPELMTY